MQQPLPGMPHHEWQRPAAAIQPSQGTWTTFYGPGTTGLRAPVVNNAA